MTFKKEIAKGFRTGTAAMRPLFILNFWAFLCFGVVCVALIPIDPASAIGLCMLSLYDFGMAGIMLFLYKTFYRKP